MNFSWSDLDLDFSCVSGFAATEMRFKPKAIDLFEENSIGGQIVVRL